MSYLPMDCPNCGRRRLEYALNTTGAVIKVICEKCAWDGGGDGTVETTFRGWRAERDELESLVQEWRSAGCPDIELCPTFGAQGCECVGCRLRAAANP